MFYVILNKMLLSLVFDNWSGLNIMIIEELKGL